MSVLQVTSKFTNDHLFEVAKLGQQGLLAALQVRLGLLKGRLECRQMQI